VRTVLVVLAALTAGCVAQSPAELDLVAAGSPENTLVVLKGAPVVAFTPPIGGTDNSWSWTVTKKPSASALSPAWGGSQWQFAPDVDGDYRVCAAHVDASSKPAVTTTACGSVSAIEHISVAPTKVHVERERALLAGSFSLAATSNESVTFQAGPDGVIASASGTLVGSDGGADAGPVDQNASGPVDVTDQEFSGPVTSTALGTITCRLLGVPGPTAVCATAPDKVPPLGDHLHWQAHVIGDVTTEPAVANVDGDVVASPPATAPHLTSLTMTSGTRFKATLAPPATGTVTIELRSFDKNFGGGFAQAQPTSSSSVEGDLSNLGQPPPPTPAGTYAVVTLVVSSSGNGIATLSAQVP
jgi:hypothetical protein